MKILKSISLTVTILLLISCMGSASSYDYIQLERRGGGDKLFNLYPTDNADTLRAEVLRYSFQETDTVIFIAKNPETESAFSTYHEILKGEQNILADTATASQQGIRMMGTWSNYYAVKDSVKTEITDEEVKATLSRFEEMLEIP